MAHENLPKGLAYQLFFRIIFGDFCSGCKLLDGGDAFSVALRAVVNFRQFLVHPILIYSSNF